MSETVARAPEKKGVVYHVDGRVSPTVAVSRAKSRHVDSRKGHDYGDITARHYGTGPDGHVVVVLYGMEIHND